MIEQFNDEKVSKNLSIFIGEKVGEYVPHPVTENEYLERCCNKGTDKEVTLYRRDVLETKIFFGEKLVSSIGSEFIENNGENRKRQKKMSTVEIKQDCETKAFIQLEGWIKKRFPHLPILLLTYSLYASKPVMNLCRDKWEFLIRYKKGSIWSIAEEYEKISEKGKTEKAEFVNEIDYDGKPVHVL